MIAVSSWLSFSLRFIETKFCLRVQTFNICELFFVVELNKEKIPQSEKT